MQFCDYDNFLNIGAEVFTTSTEKVEIIDLGQDLTADNWITWVDSQPKKNVNAQYLDAKWDSDWNTYESQFHDDHSYANKDI